MAAPPPQAAPFEVEITISSARDLKNINWKHGPLTPYAVVWVDPNNKCSTKVDREGDNCPTWDERLVIPVYAPVQDSTLYIDVVHANAADDLKKPLIGSARVPLREIVDDVGFDDKVHRSLQLKRPSGRPHGRLEVKLMVRENRYRGPDPYYASPYGVPPPGSQSRGFDPYGAPPPAGYPAYGGGYAPPPSGYAYNTAPPPSGYAYNTAPPPSGYPYSAPAPYGSAAPPSTGYGYNSGQSQYGGGAYDSQGSKDGSSTQKKGSKYGVGTGIAVGAVAGVLGGLAIAGGVDYVEDKFDEKVDERVDEQLADDGDFGGYDDDY